MTTTNSNTVTKDLYSNASTARKLIHTINSASIDCRAATRICNKCYG